MISFEKTELPPVDGFWSLTIYDSATTAMVPNKLKRYSIGDRTRSLVTDKSSALRICIQNHEPVDPDCNWLPGPRGEFYLIIRLYAPQATVINGDWKPAPIIKVN